MVRHVRHFLLLLFFLTQFVCLPIKKKRVINFKEYISGNILFHLGKSKTGFTEMDSPVFWKENREGDTGKRDDMHKRQQAQK